MSSYGLVGLGAIGQNLALNIQKKTDVHVYNRTPQKVNELMKRGLGIHGHESLCEMISSMEFEGRTLPHTAFVTLVRDSPVVLKVLSMDQPSCLVVINSPTTIIENFLRLSVKMLHTWVMILGLVITQRWFIME